MYIYIYLFIYVHIYIYRYVILKDNLELDFRGYSDRCCAPLVFLNIIDSCNGLIHSSCGALREVKRLLAENRAIETQLKASNIECMEQWPYLHKQTMRIIYSMPKPGKASNLDNLTFENLRAGMCPCHPPRKVRLCVRHHLHNVGGVSGLDKFARGPGFGPKARLFVTNNCNCYNKAGFNILAAKWPLGLGVRPRSLWRALGLLAALGYLLGGS